MHKTNVRAIKRCLKWRKEHRENMDKNYVHDIVFFKSNVPFHANFSFNMYEWNFIDIFRQKCATIE